MDIWKSPYQGCLGTFTYLLKVVKANSANPDQMAHSWMSDLVLQF